MKKDAVPEQNSEFAGPVEKALLSEVASIVPFVRLSYEMERTSLQTSEPLRVSLHAFGHELVAHHPCAMVKAPAYFVSFSPTTKTLLIAIKGSSTQSDWFTNLAITPSPFLGDEYGTHGGTLEAARFVIKRIEVFIKNFVLPCESYKIVLVGHSLGAGACILAALLLNEECGVPKERLKCYALAPPPVLSPLLAPRVRDYVVSCVFQDDGIPRTCVKSVNTVFAEIRTLKKMETDLGSWANVKKDLNSREWVDLQLETAKLVEQKNYDTIVPGRVIFLYCNPPKVPESKDLSEHLIKKLESSSSSSSSSSDEEETWHHAADDIGLLADYGAAEVGCMFPLLRVPILSSNAIYDHSLERYARALEQLG